MFAAPPASKRGTSFKRDVRKFSDNDHREINMIADKEQRPTTEELQLKNDEQTLFISGRIWHEL
jgi:hypothetical protein